MSEEPKTKPLMTKAALLARIGEAYESLLGFVENQTAEFIVEPLEQGGWSWKDTLAHIAGWEQILVRFHIGGEDFDQVIGMEGAQYRITSYDEVNAHLHQRFQSLTLDQVLKLLGDSHAQVIEALQAFPEEDLHQPHPRLSVGDAASAHWIDYIAANTYEHYEEHRTTPQD